MHDSVRQMVANKKTTYTVGCLFAGMGGFCKAFEQAGALPIWANEIERYAVTTLQRNYPQVHCVHKDVEELSPKRDSLEPVDILTAGFPCQPFSLAGETLGLKDRRGNLFEQIVRVVKAFGKSRPKIILLENVQNLKAHDNGYTLNQIISQIRKCGYWINEERSCKILNTKDYTDIPQNRSRIFIVAFNKNNFDYVDFEWPALVTKMRPLSDFLDDRRKKQDDWYYYTAEKHPKYYPLFVDEFEKVGRKSICMLRRSYVRSNKSGECPTLMANMGEGGHNQPTICDRYGIRKLTERECARFQGYRDSWFKIPTDTPRSKIYKQIGNSVTVPLVRKLAKECLRQLKLHNISL